ncbi:MAG: helix-turn-helix transcriptional regulator [Nocardioides sp.]|nr:helix-turn-helix transcriptional regulator [Nocardioides sp.]
MKAPFPTVVHASFDTRTPSAGGPIPGDQEGTRDRNEEEAMTTTRLRPAAVADRAHPWRAQRHDPVSQLSPREAEVLALMAQGRSNRAIGDQLEVELKTVETHVGRIFTKLGLNEDRHENRRVLAVLTFLGRESAHAAA